MSVDELVALIEHHVRNGSDDRSSVLRELFRLGKAVWRMVIEEIEDQADEDAPELVGARYAGGRW